MTGASLLRMWEHLNGQGRRIALEMERRVARSPHSLKGIGPRQLALLPEFPNSALLADRLNRGAWGLSSVLPEGCSLIVPCRFEEALFRQCLRGVEVPEAQENYLSRGDLEDCCRWVLADHERAIAADAEMLLVWDSSALCRPDVVLRSGSVVVIDPSFAGDTETVNVAGLSHSLLGAAEREELRETSKRRYGELLERFTGVDDAYVFFTWPSIKQGLAKPLVEKSIRLICNSIVRDDEIVDTIQPDVIAFLDPAYHFGVSRYAAEFRSHVKKLLGRLPAAVCIVPEHFALLMKRELPDGLRERVIGMPVAVGSRPNFPTADAFFVRPTGNVLTQLMVPVASAMAARVHVVGADGRRMGDKGFWGHTASVQFGDLMWSIGAAHPSLARDTDHAKYYKEHCRRTARLLEWGERRHGKVYLSETASYVPALAVRFRKAR